MKKVVLAMLLAVVLVAPVFAADEGSMEIDIKAGFNGISDIDIAGWRDVDPAFTASLDFFYYVMPQLAIGAGVEYVFNANVDKSPGKVGWTNFYAQGKYVFDLGNDLFNNIYPLVQVGLGISRLEPDGEVDTESGLYCGLGAGTTIKECVVLELLYSQNKATFKEDGSSLDVKYTTLQLKVGYKFIF